MRRLAQVLFFNAVIWLSICIWTLVRAQGGGQAITAWVIAALMLGNIAAFVIPGVAIIKSQGLFYYFVLALLGLLIAIRLKPAQWNYSL